METQQKLLRNETNRQMARILITGGSGFIGSNLVRYFHDKKHDVLNYDINKPKDVLYNDKWFEGDILDFNKLKIYLFK